MPTEWEDHRDRAHALQDELFSEICSTIEGLSESDWQRLTNCPGWVVRDIVAHLARSGRTFAAMVDTGMRGESTFAMSQEDRERIERELAELSMAQLLDRLRSAHDELRSRLAELSGHALLTLCPHSRGLQPAWWFADQRLSELAFHGWDLYFSLGREREIAPSVGQHLLPTLLERNVPTWHKTDETDSPRFGIRAVDVADGTWQVVPSAPGAIVDRGCTDGDVTIQGPSAPLIRWLYGRAELEQLERVGIASIAGDRGLLGQWKALFPAP
ncbi:MAG TPA: maleylpyruvate isomerase family mycothiol-dependent enzyme [Chloroflexota bacterium]|jgi:uncharacterized protein (TIGR03083 family)|nr:maleylpyruvate isomerase family mycothiol-dependent enzyme [Chloroflexota bacterium]